MSQDPFYQPNYPAQPGYAPQGYVPQPGYAPQPGYPAQPGYAPQGYVPQPGYAQPYLYPQNPNARSKSTAALLAFFLGWFGAHNFYRKQTAQAIGHIVLFAIGLILLIISIATYEPSYVVSPYSYPYSYSYVEDSITTTVPFIIAWIVYSVNGLWTFVEFIIVLVSDDGRLT